MTCENEYLYGRGVTDDKGPILATLYAVKELLVWAIIPLNYGPTCNVKLPVKYTYAQMELND